MNNPWKLATIGIALTAVTALTAGATTAYLVRPAATVSADSPAASMVERRGVTQPVPVRTSVPRAAVATRPVSATPASTVPADCATGQDRAWRIAKPGLLGTLLGAGVGAAGGAIADGGSGAGKGAIIGGVTGAVAGTAYGAYQTHNTCGTIFGNHLAPQTVLAAR